MNRSLEQLLPSRIAIVFAVLVAMVWGIWSVPLVDVDEGAFTEATREMIASGNYVSISLNGEPRHDKPILTYWLQAASVHLFGLDEFALRLPSVLAALVWVWALYLFAARHTDRATAGVAALLLTLSLYVGIIAKAATADALLNLFIALTLFDIYGHFERPTPGRLRRIFLWMALGFLTKGPVAVVFPAAISAAFYLSYGRGRDWLRLAFDPLGLLLFLAIVLPWHVAVYLDSGWGFFEGFYLHHNLDRYRDPMEGHGGGPFYYLLFAPLIVMPFAGWLLGTLTGFRAAMRRPLERFVWIWFLTVLLVFSFSGTKLPHYLLYGMSGLFVLMALYRDRLRSGWLHMLPAVFLFALLSVLPWLFAELAAQSGRAYEKGLFESAAKAFTGWPQGAAVFAMLLALLLLVLDGAVWRRLLLVGFVQAGLLAFAVVPTVVGVLQEGPRAAALYAREQGKELVFYRASPPSVSLYRQQIIHRREPQPGQWVYVRFDQLDEFLAQPLPYPREVVFDRAPAVLVAVNEVQGG